MNAEFALTGLSNADGNSKNHEIGVCLPHFTLELTASCKLTIKPKYAGNAHISLMQVGETDPGQPIIPRATDSVMSINEYVTNKMGYYYLKTTQCPQVYQTHVKGAKLLASGKTSASFKRGCSYSLKLCIIIIRVVYQSVAMGCLKATTDPAKATAAAALPSAAGKTLVAAVKLFKAALPC